MTDPNRTLDYMLQLDLRRFVEEQFGVPPVHDFLGPTLRSAVAANVPWLQRMGSAASLDVMK